MPAAMSSHLRRRHACHYSCSHVPVGRLHHWMRAAPYGAPAAAGKLCPGYSSRIPRVSILLPKTLQIILDKVVVLDKGTASVNAPPTLHRKITISYRLSVTHTQQ